MKPKTIDDYLRTVSSERRATLEKLRRTIRTILPSVEECISYSMPAFRLDGHVVAGFLATKSGCSYFPFSGTTLATLAEDLVGYDQTKSALHFDAKRPLSVALVRKLLKERVAETMAQVAKRARRSSQAAVAAVRRKPRPSKKPPIAKKIDTDKRS